jgi:hypothetical protein
MNSPAHGLTSFGHALNLSPQAFGELRQSNDVAHDSSLVRERMAEDGYLYLPGFLDVEEVFAVRLEITGRLAVGGAIDPAHKPAPGATSQWATVRRCWAHPYDGAASADDEEEDSKCGSGRPIGTSRNSPNG